MHYKVKRKHYNSSHCIVCGLRNEFGLKVRFYELENDMLVGIVTPKGHHQGYPGRLHGGIASTLLDETIGRAINIENPDVFGVTISLNLLYHAPIPLDTELKITGSITRNRSRIFEGEGAIILSDGTKAVTATASYLKMPISDITKSDFSGDAWFIEDEENPVKVIEL